MKAFQDESYFSILNTKRSCKIEQYEWYSSWFLCKMESVTEQMTKTDLGYEIPTWDNWSPLAKFYHPLQAGSIDGTDTVPHDKAVMRAMLAKCKLN